MEWLPAFKPGWCNVWLLMLIVPLQPVILLWMDKLFGVGDILSRMGSTPSDPDEKLVNQLYTGFMAAALVYSIFLPLQLGTGWFFTGIAVYLAGLALLFAAMAAAVKTPPDQLFTRGTYRFSRHPMYLAMVAMFFGAGIAGASWLFLLLTALMAFLLARQVNWEEAGCLDQFGGDYREYQQKTPRWLGIPGRVRQR